MGVFEMSNYAKGTIGVCEAIANLKDAVTVQVEEILQSTRNSIRIRKINSHIFQLVEEHH